MTQTETSTSRRAKRQKTRVPWWIEIPLTVALALIVAVGLKTFVAQAFYIPSESMEPGFINNDRIVVQKLNYVAGEPQRGDIVVFKDDHGWLPPGASVPTNRLALLMSKVGLYPTGGHLVKRVIGVAGDKIVCCDKSGRIKVNGFALDEADYVLADPASPCNGPMADGGSCKWQVGPIPDGKIFVMGDNRANSGDSSMHLGSASGPFIDTEDVVGRVFVLLWPVSRFTTVPRPEVFADIPAP